MICRLGVIFSFLLFAAFVSRGQADASLVKQADSLYQEGAFAEAGLAYDRLIQQDSTEAEYFHRRGTCLLQLDKPEEAEPYLKQALRLDPDYAKSYYNLGLIRVKNGQFEEGLAFFQAFYKREPLDPDGVYNVAFAFASLSREDSFDTYFQRALKLKPDMLYAYENGPETYLFFGEEAKATFFIEKGLLQFPAAPSLYQKAISIYNVLEQPQQALTIYQRAKAQFPLELSWYHGTAIKRIQANTSPEMIIHSEKETRIFRDISIANLGKMNAWVADRKSNYRYEELFKKWKNSPETMALDDYFMLNYGHSKQKNYDPSSSAAMKKLEIFQELFKAGDYQEALQMIEESIQLAPTQINLHFWKASCIAKMGDFEGFEKAIQHYYGFALGILHSGDGTSFETAYLITNYEDKYAIMDLLNLKVSDSMDVAQEGNLFSILIDQEEEAERKVCFWVGK